MSENIPKMGYTGFHAKSPFGRRGRKSYNECTFGMKACIQSTYASLDHHHTHVTREIHNHVKKDRCRDEWMYTRIGDGSTLERNSFESHSTTWGDWIRKNNRKIFSKKVRVDNLLWETKGNGEWKTISFSSFNALSLPACINLQDWQFASWKTRAETKSNLCTNWMRQLLINWTLNLWSSST